MNSFKTIVKNHLSGLQKASGEVELFLDNAGISGEVVFTVHLVIEEMLSNVIKYAFKDTASHDISLEIAVEKNKLNIIIEDEGIEFNPLSITVERTDLPINEREVGGLGIHLVKNMVEDMSYCRKNGRNILKMTILLPLSNDLG